MFVLKKIISAFLLPLPIGLFLLFLGLMFLLFNSYKKAKLFIFLSFLWFTLLSSSIVSNALIKPLEDSHNALLNTPKVEYILVLGSGHNTNENLSITSQVTPTGINRLAEGIRHYKNLENAKLVLSGYGAKDENSHALMQEKLAISLGVKAEDIIKQDSPRDTKEEAMAIKKIVGQNPFILVTSASHMKRAVLLFQKEGLNFIASPTNHYVSKDRRIFSAKNLRKCEMAIHEYLGLLYSWIRNDI